MSSESRAYTMAVHGPSGSQAVLKKPRNFGLSFTRAKNKHPPNNKEA